MKLAATFVLALCVPAAALAAPRMKPRAQSPAASAATARIAEQNIPKLVKFAKPKPADLASVLPSAAAPANPGQAQPATPPAATDPLLTAEELAVDVVELTPQALHSSQIGTACRGVETFGRHPGIWLTPGQTQILFAVSSQWISGRSLLVECTGDFPEPHWIRLWRTQAFENKADYIGNLNLDLEGNTLALVVPATQLGGWDRLSMAISDADSVGSVASIDKCTFTRL